MDTLDETLAPTPPEEPGQGRSRRAWLIALAAVVVVLAGLVASALVRVPYFTISPGSLRVTETLISVEGAPTYVDEEGEIGFTTISLRSATALRAVIGWLDPDTTVVNEQVILGGRTEDESRDENLRDMTDSQQVASAVALRELGYEVRTTGSGALVLEVKPDLPAASVLQVNDLIVAIDGQPIQLADQLVEAVRSRLPGDRVLLDVRRPGVDATLQVETVLVERPDDPSQAMLGVATATQDLAFEFPVQVTIDSGDVGGPSAGLAFTLGVMDVLTPGSITGGARVATTGTIGIDGRVGPVGGVAQKAVTVRRSGADLFLVPSSELETARLHAGGMRVEPVDSIDDALKVLESLGGGSAVVQAQGGS